MALLGRLIALTQDTSGTSSVGASVTVMKQGAQVKGTQAGPAYTVDDCGGIVVGDVVFAASAPSTQRAVTAVSATSVTTGAPGLGTLSDDDRILVATALPTLYLDAAGTDSTTNPLTSDASGVASSWVPGGFYDIDFSGGSPSLTRAFQYDVYVSGYVTVSDVYNSGSAIAYKFDTLRTLGAADKIVQVTNNGVEEFSVGGTGNMAVGGTLAITGAVTLSSTLAVGATTVTGALSATTTVTAGTGVTATTGNVQASAATGYLIGSRLGGIQGTSHVVGDYALNASWGNTASLAIVGAAYDSHGYVRITCNGAGIAVNPIVTLTFKNGAWAGGRTPFVIGVPGTGNSVFAPATDLWYCAGTQTQAIFWLGGTPTAGRNYDLIFHVLG